MLVIRLQRTGRKNLPSYRLVVAEKARAAKGKFLEIIGHYLPQREPVTLEFQEERITYWIGKGAIPSDTVARILNNKGVKGLEKFIVRYAKRKPKGEAAEAEAAPAAAPAPVAPAGDTAEKKE